MFGVLRNPTYSRLFSAQIVALLGTGLLTVALGLLAYDIAGGEAGAVMGVAMTVKMVAYVGISPLMAALVARRSAKHVLIVADIARAAVALCLPFVTSPWQIYVLIFLLQSASATFTPTFQAVIPSVLPDENEYTQALSLSRLAYDLESLVSPMLAAALLTLISYNNLFLGTVVGFVLSALLVLSARFPMVQRAVGTGFLDRATQGIRAFWDSRELRGLMGVNLVVATTSAMVIVNTVVLVQAILERSQSDVAVLHAAYGGGSMFVAIMLPRLLHRVEDRRVMLAGAVALPSLLLAVAGAIRWGSGALQWATFLVLYVLVGAATSMILTPSARLLRRNSDEGNRSAVFAGQFSLSHACFLVTYPLAGLGGAAMGLSTVAVVLVSLGMVGAVVAWGSWCSAAVLPAR